MNQTIKTKQCSECNRNKPLDQFHRNSQGKNGRHGKCKECRRYILAHKTMRKCKTCGQEQLAINFVGKRRNCIKCANKKKQKCVWCNKIKNANEFTTSVCKSCHGNYHKSSLRKYKSYAYDAKRRNLNFYLTCEDFQSYWQKPCAYCGSEIETIGIDRMDNTKGYSVDNCCSSCFICNKAKHTMSAEKFKEHIIKIYNHLILKGK